MNNTSSIVRTLKESIEKGSEKKTGGYDTIATVSYIEDGVAWVRIPGGDDDTPVALTMAARAGDQVQVRVANGGAFMIGNATSPPTDDTTALMAAQAAAKAGVAARNAQSSANAADAHAADALVLANGKNKIYYRSTAPNTDLTTGDLWFNTAEGNAIYEYTGTQWQLRQLAQGALAANSVTALEIYVSSLSAISANVGTITAGVLKSSDYRYTSGNYSAAGMIVDLNNKIIRTPKTAILADGTIYSTAVNLTGYVNATSGKIGPWSISDASIYYNDTTTGRVASFSPGSVTGGINNQRYYLDAVGVLELNGSGGAYPVVTLTDLSTNLRGEMYVGSLYLNSKETLSVSGSKLYVGGSDFTGVYIMGGNTFFNSNGELNTLRLYVNQKLAMQAGDTWLRINDSGANSSGVYFGTSYVRTDGSFRSGAGNAGFTDINPGAVTARYGDYNALQIIADSSGAVRFWTRTAANATYNLLTRANNSGEVTTGGTKWIFPIRTDFTSDLYFTDYSDTLRKPVASTSADGGRVAYLQMTSNTQARIGGQNGTAGSAIANRTWTVSSSDIRLKEHIEDTKVTALDTLNAIRLREFDWKDHDHWKIGMIADEVEKIDPKLAAGGGYDEDGVMNIKSIDTFYLTGYLVKAIQELSAQIKALKGGKA